MKPLLVSRPADLLAVVLVGHEPARLPAVPGPPQEPRPRAGLLPPRVRQRQEDLRVQVLQRRTGARVLGGFLLTSLTFLSQNRCKMTKSV